MSLKLLAVDDERPALDYLVRQLRVADPGCEVAAFTDPLEALDYMKAHSADIAFLDIEMCGLTGIELAKRFKETAPQIAIVFVTGFSQYAVDAFSLHASGYLLKPPAPEAIRAEIELALHRRPPEPKGRVRMQTFGSFEVFVDGAPVRFSRSKSKELLAYLVDRRGAGVSTQELIGVLFEDREANQSTGSLLRNVVSGMMLALKQVGADNIIVKSHNSLAVNQEAFSCDYYDFLAGDMAVINAYTGEYMSNYSWAELTTGVLDDKAGLY